MGWDQMSWPARVPMLNASVACESDVGLVLAIERAGCAVTVVAAGKTFATPVSRSHRANTSHQRRYRSPSRACAHAP